MSVQERYRQLVQALEHALANRFGVPVQDLSPQQLEQVSVTAYRALLNAQRKS